MTEINTHLLIRPNYSTGVNVSKVWRTGIQKAIAAPEKRIRVFSWSRLMTRFTVNAMDWFEMEYTRRKIHKYNSEVVGVPVWPDLDTVQSEAASGQKDVTITETDFTFYLPGRPIVLMDPDDLDVFESGVIDTVADPVITLVDNLSNTWPIGTEIAPVIAARVGDRQSFRFSTDRHIGTTIEAREAFEG